MQRPRTFPARRPLTTLAQPLAALALGWCLLLPACLWAADDWQEVSRAGDLSIAVRERSGSAVKEVRAVGSMDFPPWVVKNVLDDVDGYTEFMPYTKEAKRLSRDPNGRSSLVYMKLDPPLVGPRDVTIRIQDDASKNADGSSAISSRWTAENASGPSAKPGVTRISLDEGSWVLVGSADGKSTKATYSLYTDGGGNLPPFVINMANKKSVTDLFEAVRKRAQNAKYRQGGPDATASAKDASKGS